MDVAEGKNFCASKDTIKQMKRQAKKWGEYLPIIYLIKD